MARVKRAVAGRKKRQTLVERTNFLSYLPWYEGAGTAFWSVCLP